MIAFRHLSKNAPMRESNEAHDACTSLVQNKDRPFYLEAVQIDQMQTRECEGYSDRPRRRVQHLFARLRCRMIRDQRPIRSPRIREQVLSIREQVSDKPRAGVG